MPDRLTFEDWTSKLREHFFSEANAGVPITFFVDGEVLADVGGFADPREAEMSLTSTVRPRLLPESSGDVFRRVVDESWTWRIKNPASDPPFLPVLAVCVLAAAKMAATERWAAHNYYEPFRALSGLHGGGGMPGGYDGAMPALWGHLVWWLDEYKQGRLGTAAIPTHPTPAYIGYALSQALFRASDRQKLSYFFQALDLAPGEFIEPAELLAYFKAWSQRSNLSASAKEMARRPEYEEILSAILAAEARRWDGSLRDEHGRRVGQILILLDLYLRPRLVFVAERPSGFPASTSFSFGESYGSIHVEAASDEYYGEIPIKVSASVLDEGLRGTVDGIALTFSASPVIPLRQEEGLGGWASSRQLLPGVQHWILVRADHSIAVRDYLSESAMAEWREASGIAPSGWTMFRDVVIEAADALPADSALSRIVPSVRERPSLWGGLSLSVSPYMFLVGGEPDVWVPSAEDGVLVPIVIDGDRSEVEFRGGRISLRDNRLPAGHHDVEIGPSRLGFETVESLGVISSRAAALLGHKLTSANGRFYPISSRGASARSSPTRGTVEVIGTSLLGSTEDLPAKPEPPLLLPAKASRYLVLGSVPGQIDHPHVPSDPPRWVEGIGPFSAGREFTPLFDVVWVLLERMGGWEGRLRHSLSPQAFDPDTTTAKAVREWCRCFLDLSPRLPETCSILWAQYRSFAEEVLI